MIFLDELSRLVWLMLVGSVGATAAVVAITLPYYVAKVRRLRRRMSAPSRPH
jgi:hypothetical protein